MLGVEGAPAISSPLSGALSSSASKEDALAFYKAQYEQLETELADFQASSRELESELERDVEEAEKRERKLREKVEAVGFEVEEWKTKCKQSKVEANNAQNALQKEITMLRDTNRTLQMKLRDVEVANDDYERQTRNTTSSLEDVESKYNIALERSVILEGEMKEGEQERENLRIEAQRLRDELSDLKVEAEIRQDKLHRAEAAFRNRIPTSLGTSISRPRSSISEHSQSGTTASSPTVATPPTKSVSSVASDAPTPPSPPTSDKSLTQHQSTVTPANGGAKSRLSITNSITPRPVQYSSLATPRHSRGPSAALPNNFNSLITPSTRRTTLNRSNEAQPSSASLTQIRGLIGKMQKLEARVQSARSKLPAPTSTPPRGSPRPGSALSQSSSSFPPAGVTVRSTRKRSSATPNGTTSSTTGDDTGKDSNGTDTRRATLARPSSRLSFGLAATSTDAPAAQHSLNSGVMGGFSSSSRPSSRASLSSRQSLSHLPSGIQAPSSAYNNSTNNDPAASSGTSTTSRPSSRQSLTGARTPLGHYPTNADRIASRPRSSIGGSYATNGERPRSSIGGSYAELHSLTMNVGAGAGGGGKTNGQGHGYSASVSRLSTGSGYNATSASTDEVLTPTPSRRTTLTHPGTAGVGVAMTTTAPSAASPSKRLSGTTGLPVVAGGGSTVGAGRRISSGTGDMAPPGRRRKLSGVGESY